MVEGAKCMVLLSGVRLLELNIEMIVPVDSSTFEPFVKDLG